MAFPTLDSAISLERVLQGGQAEARNMKQYLTKTIRVMGDGSLSANAVIQIAQVTKAFCDVMQKVIDAPGIDKYSQNMIGRPITGDAQAIIDGASAVISAVKDTMAHGDGFIPLQKIEANGDVSTKALTPEDMKELKSTLEGFAALIE